MYPIGMIEDVVRYSSELVFSGAFTMNDAKSRAPNWVPEERTHLVKHWPSALDDGGDAERICHLFRPDGRPQKTIGILGAGFCEFTKRD